MSEPGITLAVLKKLLSLDSPVATRIFELALLVVFIFACIIFGENHKNNAAIQGAVLVIGMLCGMVAFMMFLGLFMTVMDSLPKGKRR